MADVFIDAEGAIVGRLGTYVAKQALLGHTVKIMNCEKAILSGSKKNVVGRYHRRRRDMGQPMKGPFIPKMPDRFVRRIIRGMLPYKRARGSEAFKRIMCYIGVPSQFTDKKLEKIKEADVSKLTALKYVTIGEVCKLI